MSNNNSIKFIDFLDNSSKSNTHDHTYYSILTNVIQDHYLKNSLNNQTFSGKKTNNSISDSDNNNPRAYLFFNNADISNNDYYLAYDYSLWNNSTSCCTDESNNPYQIWQKQHEANITASAQPTEKMPTKYLHIDASINTLIDIISIIEKNEYSADTEYNFDLKSLHNVKDELILLNNMVGMEQMKQSILDQLIYFMQDLHLGKDAGKETSDFKHTVIYGPPGTGKTEVAKIIGKMYSKLGILKNNIFKKVTRNDLIAGYLGQTAIKTKKVIEECLGGVLFIDEAYSLANSEKNDSFSKECLDILCEALSDHKNDLMVIIAGYENELNETFFLVNSGLKSRFIWRFTMEPYNSKEMMCIFKKKVLEQEWGFENDETLKERWFEEKKSTFKHYGRDMEQLFTFIKISHGRRIYGKSKELRKQISIADMIQGYDTFMKNVNLKKESNIIHSFYV